jgi:hypothetical protein
MKAEEAAKQVLADEYFDYKKNSWHYDRQYMMIIKAIKLFKSQPKPAVEQIQGESAEESYDAILDTHQQRVYSKSECDKEMIDLFPERYIKIKLSETLKNTPDKAIIAKQEELIEALNNQVALVCSDSFADMEGYGYKALASSQKITRLEQELAALRTNL